MFDKIDLYIKLNKWVFKDEKNVLVMFCILKKDFVLCMVIDVCICNLNMIFDVIFMFD